MSVDRLALRNRHRAKGPPVVPALHRDDVLLVCDPAHHFERGLDRLRARIYEEERIKRRVRHDGKQAFYEAQVRRVVRNAALIAAQNGVAGVMKRGGRTHLSVHKVEALVRCCFAHFWMAVTWILNSQHRLGREKDHSNVPKFVTPMPDVKSSNFRPLCIVTHGPSPSTMTSSVRWFSPFETWRCPNSTSGAVVIERPL